jgi:transcriptional regulator with XRE-family HTH domain
MELAERAKLDLTSISEIESGLRNPSTKTLHKIALALKIPLKELFS